MAVSKHSDLVFDVGMHRGEDTDFYLKKGFRVIGIEANPALCEECAERFASEIQANQLTIVNSAVAEIDGEIDFYLNPGRSVWGTADPAWVERNEKQGQQSIKTRVVARPFSSLIQQYGVPYYLKIDIEGFDHLCLSGLIGFDHIPEHVSVESSATDQADTMYQLSLMHDLGYKRFKLVPQHDVNKQRCPRPAREGNEIDYSFPNGSSGLFGEEAPGDWMSYDAIRSEYEKIYRQVALVGPHTGRFRNIQNRYVRGVLNRLFWRGLGWYDTHASI
ncbi:MAG: FkbM family methyltransferase [Pseudomonadota bacterium]